MINCEVARDLLPLYKDMALNPSNAEMVEEHLKSCEDCVTELARMQGNLRVNQTSEQDTQKSAIKYIKKRRFKRSILAVCTAIGVAVIMGLTAYFYKMANG